MHTHMVALGIKKHVQMPHVPEISNAQNTHTKMNAPATIKYASIYHTLKPLKYTINFNYFYIFLFKKPKFYHNLLSMFNINIDIIKYCSVLTTN